MAEVTRLEGAVDIRGIDSAVHQLNQLNAAGEKAAHSLNSIASRGAGVTGVLSSIATGAVSTAAGFALFQASSAIMGSLGQATIGLNNTLELAAMGFETMTGSAEQAQALLAQLRDFAVKTPFEFPDLVKASQRFMAMGFAASDIIPTLTSVGDAMAASGRITSDVLNRVTLALAQINTKGRVMTQEMNQLTEAGIPAWQLLAKQMGITTQQLQKMVEDGAVPAGKAIKDLTTGINQQFGGAMTKASTTFLGAMSNIKDAVGLMIADGFQPLFKVLTEAANKIAKFVATDQWKQWAGIIQGYSQAVADGLRELFSGDFEAFGTRLKVMAEEGGAALLHLANAALPAVMDAIRGLANLGAEAFSWGANLAFEYAKGLAEGAASAIVAALNAIGEMVMSFLAGHSPPEKGPLRTIDVGGTAVMNAWLSGFSKADFSILERVTKAVSDILTKQVDLGQLDKTALIPALLGGQNAVANAIGELKEFGQVTEATVGALREYVGEGADAVLELVENLAKLGKLQDDVAKLNDRLRDLDKETRNLESQTRSIKDKYQEQITTLERGIRSAERFYDAQIRPGKQLIDQLEREIELRRKALGVDVPVSEEERKLEIEVAKEDVLKAQNAHLERQAKLQKDLAKAEADLAEEQEKGTKADPRRLAELGTAAAEAAQKLAKEGVQTAEDRLNIEQRRRDLLQAEADLREATDPQLKASRERLENEETRVALLENERDNIIAPMETDLQRIKDLRDDELEVINDKLDRIRDERSEIQGQVADLQAQMEPLEEAIGLTEARLKLEGEVAAKLREQEDLLQQLAEAAENAAKAAAGKAAAGNTGGAAKPGLGGLIGGGGVALPTVKPIEIRTPDFNLKGEAAKLEKQLKEEIETAVRGAMDKLKDPSIWAPIAGGVIGAVVGAFTPLGPVLGAGIGATLGAGIGQAIPKIKEMLLGKDVILSENVLDQMLGTDKKHVEGRFEKQFEGLSKAAEQIFRRLGVAVAPIVEEFVIRTQARFKMLQDWWDENGENVVKAAENVIKLLVAGFEVGMKLLLPVFKLLNDNVDMALKGVLEVAEIVVAVLAGDWDKILGKATSFAESFIHVFLPMAEAITKVAMEIGPPLIKAIVEIAKTVGGTLVDAFKAASSFISGEGKSAFDAVKGVIEAVIPTIKSMASVFTDDVLPAIKGFGSFLTGEGKSALSALADLITGTVLPAAQALGKWFVDDILPPMNNTKDFINGQLVPAIKAIADFFTNTLIPAGQSVADFITGTVVPALGSIADFIEGALKTAIDTIADVLESVLISALRTASNFITNTVIPALTSIADFIRDTLQPVIETVADVVTSVFESALRTVSNFISSTVIPAATTLADTVKTVLSGALNTAAGAAIYVWEKLGDFGGRLSDLWQKAQDVGGVVQTWLIDKFNDLTGKLGGLISHLWGGGEGGGGKGLLPALAELLIKANPIAAPVIALANGVDALVGAIGRVLGPLKDFADLLGKIPIPDQLKWNSPPPLGLAFDYLGGSLDNLNPKVATLAGGFAALIATSPVDIILAMYAAAGVSTDQIEELNVTVSVAAATTEVWTEEMDQAAIAAYNAAKAQGDLANATLAAAAAAEVAAAASEKMAAAQAAAAAAARAVPTGGGGGGTPGSSGFDLEKATAWINFVNSIVRPMLAAMAHAQNFTQTMVNIANGMSQIEPAARGAASGIREFNSAIADTQVPEPLQMHSPPPLATALDMVAAAAQKATDSVAQFNATLAAGANASNDAMVGWMSTASTYQFDGGAYGIDRAQAQVQPVGRREFLYPEMYPYMKIQDRSPNVHPASLASMLSGATVILDGQKVGELMYPRMRERMTRDISGKF